MRGIAIISILALVLLMAACQKEHVNPFDRDDDPVVNTPTPLLPLDNFAGLHQRIFRPTCAVSGCHDGSFEPDLRTIGSAYNSLVYHPVIGNDPTGSFSYRVTPGDHQASYLHERLVAFVPNTSGIMPLGFVEGSDWPTQQNTYIQAIRSWIDTGARDMFGTLPTLGNLQPQAVGLLAFAPGQSTNPYTRMEGPGVQPIAVPAALVDVWFAFLDDQTAAPELTHNTYKFATAPTGFAAVPEQPFTLGQSIQGNGFGNSTATFTHKASLDLTGFPVGTQVFVRAYVNDGDQPVPVEIPNDGTGSPMRDHFTLIIVP